MTTLEYRLIGDIRNNSAITTEWRKLCANRICIFRVVALAILFYPSVLAGEKGLLRKY
jgi:hypothetical protein